MMKAYKVANVAGQAVFGVLFCAVLGSPAIAQEINFNDLKRAGAPVVKQYTLQGTKTDGERYLLQFEGKDGDRIAALNSVRSGGNSSPSAPWQILRSEAISRHNWVREIRMKCLQGPAHKIGSEHTVWMINDGRAELSVGIGTIKQKNFDAAAKFACSID